MLQTRASTPPALLGAAVPPGPSRGPAVAGSNSLRSPELGERAALARIGRSVVHAGFALPRDAGQTCPQGYAPRQEPSRRWGLRRRGPPGRCAGPHRENWPEVGVPKPEDRARGSERRLQPPRVAGSGGPAVGLEVKGKGPPASSPGGGLLQAGIAAAGKERRSQTGIVAVGRETPVLTRPHLPDPAGDRGPNFRALRCRRGRFGRLR